MKAPHLNIDSAVVALRRLYDDVYKVLVDDSFTGVVGLVMTGISDVHKLGERYMALVRYDIVDWDPPTLGERIPYVITTGRGTLAPGPKTRGWSMSGGVDRTTCTTSTTS